MKKRAKPLKLRPAVMKFAELMEGQLRRNDHRSGWEGIPAAELLQFAEGNVLHVRRLLTRGERDRDLQIKECADAANYLMMAADRLGRVKKAERSKQ